MNNFSERVSFIWGVADLLRGDYKQSEYGRVIMPLLVLRRLDQVLVAGSGLRQSPRLRLDCIPENGGTEI